MTQYILTISIMRCVTQVIGDQQQQIRIPSVSRLFYRWVNGKKAPFCARPQFLMALYYEANQNTGWGFHTNQSVGTVSGGP